MVAAQSVVAAGRLGARPSHASAIVRRAAAFQAPARIARSRRCVPQAAAEPTTAAAAVPSATAKPAEDAPAPAAAVEESAVVAAAADAAVAKPAAAEEEAPAAKPVAAEEEAPVAAANAAPVEAEKAPAAEPAVAAPAKAEQPAAAKAAAALAEKPAVAAAEPAKAPAAAPASSSAASTAPITYTSYEGNAFRVQFSRTGINVLVDPWLVGKLTFGGLDFVYAGSKRVARPEAIGDLDQLAAETDLIVLSQGIDDHAHRPTLQRLPKTIPVVASAAGAAVARSLGFRTVYTLRPGQTLGLLGGALTIRATEGALVGPPWSQRELGLVLQENLPAGQPGASLYYEPHADYVEDSVRRVAPVDVVVSPPCSQILLGYPLVKGATDTLSLLRLLRPKVFVPLNNAEFDQSGPLADLLVEEGSAEQLEAQLAADPQLKGVRVCVPKAAQPMPVEL